MLSSGIEAGVLVALVRRPPGVFTGSERPLVRAAAAAAGLSVGLTALTLPISALLRRRSLAVGLSTQSWGGWAGDQAKALGLGTALASAGGTLFVALVRRLPRSWWLPGAGGVLGLSTAMLFVGPVLLDPIFNRFTPLPAGRARDDVLDLARRAGVDVGEVFEVDASRRTTASNAYVTGLGRTKRVVLFDTLLRDFTPEEVNLVVAHELSHVRHRDVPRGLLFLLVAAPASLYAIRELIEAWLPDPEERESAAILPAVALAGGIVGAVVSIVSNQLSRAIERRADSYALTLTEQPEPFIGFERRIVEKNIADPDPPRLLTLLMATHPPAVERIGIGVAFASRRTQSSQSSQSAEAAAPPPPRTQEGS